MKTFIAYSIFIVCFMPYSQASDIDFSDPNSILDTIKKNSANHVVRYEINNWETWDNILTRIKTGEKLWVKVAIALRPGTDAGFSESLGITIAYALPNAPENILPIIGNGFEIDDVCGFPFIEPKDAFLMEHYNKSVKSLRGVKDPNLERIKQECLQTLTYWKNKIFKNK